MDTKKMLYLGKSLSTPIFLKEKNIDINKNSMNYSKVGNVIVEDGIASNFSSSSYIDTNYIFTPGKYSWEIQVKLLSTDRNAGSQSIYAMSASNYIYGPYIAIVYNTIGRINCSLTDGSNLLFGFESLNPIEENKWYWLKVSYDGSNMYGFYISEDGKEYVLQGEVESEKLVKSSKNMIIGYSPSGTAWKGKIDLNETYFQINGSPIKNVF